MASPAPKALWQVVLPDCGVDSSAPKSSSASTGKNICQQKTLQVTDDALCHSEPESSPDYKDNVTLGGKVLC